MLDICTVQSVCERTEKYWRSILARRGENDYFVGKLSGQRQERVQAAVCTINAVHTLFPIQSEFQKSNRRGLVLHGTNRPLWVQNAAGIWHPIIATVFSKLTGDDVVEDISVKDILRLLMLRVMDSIYILVVEINNGVARVQMVNLFDKLDCVCVRNRGTVSTVIDVKKILLAREASSSSPQEQMDTLLKIYQRLVERTVSGELAAFDRLSRRCKTFMKSDKCLVVNRAAQNFLFA